MTGMKTREIAPVVKIVPLREQGNDSAYWRTRPPAERIEALERMRSEYYAWKGNVQPGFQRVYRIVKRK